MRVESTSRCCGTRRASSTRRTTTRTPTRARRGARASFLHVPLGRRGGRRDAVHQARHGGGAKKGRALLWPSVFDDDVGALRVCSSSDDRTYARGDAGGGGRQVRHQLAPPLRLPDAAQGGVHQLRPRRVRRQGGVLRGSAQNVRVCVIDSGVRFSRRTKQPQTRAVHAAYTPTREFGRAGGRGRGILHTSLSAQPQART